MLDLPVKSYELPNGATINRDGRDPEYWTVTHFNMRLSKTMEWDFQPLPSNRTDDWIADHSFRTPEEAYDAFLASSH